MLSLPDHLRGAAPSLLPRAGLRASVGRGGARCKEGGAECGAVTGDERSGGGEGGGGGRGVRCCVSAQVIQGFPEALGDFGRSIEMDRDTSRVPMGAPRVWQTFV